MENQMDLTDVFGLEILPKEKKEEAEEMPVVDDGLEHIKAKFIFCRYQDTDSGYCVCEFKVADATLSRFTVTGNFIPQNKNLTYILHGSWVEHKQYGLQFNMVSYEEYVAPNKASIVDYLSSGVIKGIGKKTADKIYAEFGNDTIKILDKEPEKLLKIKGMSKAKLEKIIESYKESRGAKDLITYLLPMGLTTNIIMRVYNMFKAQSLLVVKDDPYKLCAVKGISFTTADLLAKKANLPMDSYSRFRAGVHYLFQETEAGGSLGVEMTDFGRRIYNILNDKSVNYEKINQMTTKMIEDGFLAVIKTDFGDGIKRFIFQKNILELERECAYNICRIAHEEVTPVDRLDEKIERVTDRLHIKLDDIQKEAVKNAFLNPISVITGGPGTGKTTIIKTIAELFKQEFPKKKMLFSAPTGKAARRITESSGYEASTIHKLTRYRAENHDFEHDEEEFEISDSLFVVDEFSMTDTFLASHVFKCLKENNNIVIVGDIDQLPSVGAGCVLRDIIDSQTIKTTRLENVYRQDENAEIAQNAKRMRLGDTNIKEGSDFKMFEIRDMQRLEDIIIARYQENIRIYGIENVMVLAPFRKHIAGINALNAKIQSAVNPMIAGKNELTYNGQTFREGDIVMNLVNGEEASNGDTGVVESVNPTDYTVTVSINGSEIEYDRENLDELTLAYAITYHKSQGSEADCVIMSLTHFHKRMGYRNLPYTGATRGKKMVEFLGEKEALSEAIKNTSPTKRITSLCRYLRLLYGQYIAA